jgi:hypothetical protein
MTSSTRRLERLDPGLGLDAVEQVGVVDVPGGEIGQRAAAAVFEFDQRWTSRTDRHRLMAATSACRWDFSSAQITSSFGAQPLALEHARVEVQRAGRLDRKSGSRGKIHDLVCHGLIASSCSQRQIVCAEASLTPRSITSRCSSTREKRAGGRPCDSGNSHAIALTSATCSGGKTTRSTRPRLVAQPRQPMLGESSPPTTNQPRRAIQPGRDLGVVQPLGRVEHDPRALHIPEGQLLRPCGPLEHHARLLAELNPVTGRTRHRPQIQRTRPDPSHIPTDTSGRAY